jgi:hypothetical protein
MTAFWRNRWSWFRGFAFFAATISSHAGEESGVEFFEKKIRPVLVERCYECHSAESKKVKGGLRLDTRDAVLKGGDSGPALLPGDPEKSLLIKAVRYGDPDLQMPPKDKKLPEASIADLVTWVRLGAPDPRTNQVAEKSSYDFAEARKLWAFHPPSDPVPPRVKNEAWIREPLDRFILAKLEEKNLHPATRADKRTLLRRATFDLTGLPPTIDEIDAFLADDSANAFEKVIERLLASPSYGERWGRHWLDQARYADSVDARQLGLPGDIVDAWRYRDWVVQAFNHDMPYDQFVMRQIAGDLLNDTNSFDPENIVATSFLSIGRWEQGEADKEKMMTDIVDDQIDVVGRTLLGLTLACARCHDHKFDPIPTEDYYSLAGIFFSSHIIPNPGDKAGDSPRLRVPLASPAEMSARKKREEKIGALELEMERTIDAGIEGRAREMLEQVPEYLVAAWDKNSGPTAGQASAPSLESRILERWRVYLGWSEFVPLTNLVKNVGGKTGVFAWKNAVNADTPSVTINATAELVDLGTPKLPPHSVSVHPSPSVDAVIAWQSPVAGEISVRGRVADADGACGDGIEWELTLNDAELTLAAGSLPNGGSEEIGVGNKNSTAGTPEITAKVERGDWLRLIVKPKTAYECDTTRIVLEIREKGGAAQWWKLEDTAGSDAETVLPDSSRTTNPWHFQFVSHTTSMLPEKSALGSWRRERRERPVASMPDLLASARPVAGALQKVREQIRAAKESLSVTNDPDFKVYLDLTDPNGAFWKPLRGDLSFLPDGPLRHSEILKTEIAELKNHPPPPLEYAHGVLEGGVPKSMYAEIGDAKIHVRGRYDRQTDSVPRRFPRLLAGDERKPIERGSGRLELARWIASPGNPMTARVMVNRLWQFHFGEGIVRTPGNFGKLGTPPTHPELLDYLAHRFVESGWSLKTMHRLIMRSAAYQQGSSNRECAKIDPENLWFSRVDRRRLDSEELRDALLAVSGGLDYSLGGPSTNDLASARRTLYLTMIRSDRSNYRMLFDAADPTAIVEKRTESTVAPQALFLLNHPFMAERAKGLVRHLSSKHSAADKIQWLYSRLYGRSATPRELELGQRAVDGEAGQADDYVWERYCQVLLCANEFIYVD